MDPVEPNDRTSADRLAELVIHLTDCDPQQAVDFVDLTERPITDPIDKLEVVARAMVRLRHASRPGPSIDLRTEESEKARTLLD